MIIIKNYTAENKDAIKKLNYEWLQKYFRVEDLDVQVLSDPQGEILDEGGMIFYAWNNDEIAGTVSLLKTTETSFELSKMAVTQNRQGLGIGKLLMEHAINAAKEAGAEKLILYSNTKLQTAITLYRKYGFEEMPLENNHYERCNIMMEKML